jgi:hypothetical protein
MANREPVKRLQLMPQGVVPKYPCAFRSSRAGLRWRQIGTALLSVGCTVSAGVARAVRASGRLTMAAFRRLALGTHLLRIGRAARSGFSWTVRGAGRGMAAIGRWLGRTVQAGMRQGLARLRAWSSKRAHQAELPAAPSFNPWNGLTDNLYDSTLWQERSLVRNQVLRHEIGVVRAHLAAQEKELARAAAHIARLRGLVRSQQQALEDAAKELHDRDENAEVKDDLLIAVTEDSSEQQFGRGRLF